MRINKVLLSVLAMVFLIAIESRADIAFAPTLSYIAIDQKDSNSNPEDKDASTSTYIDLRLGYVMPMGVYLGGIYGMESGSITENSSKTTINESRYGASLGFIMGSFNLIAHYMLSGAKSSKSDSGKIEYSNGSGFQFDIGWKFDITPTISFGPQITHRSMIYSKRKATAASGATTEGTKNYSETETLPHLAFWFMF